MGGQHGPIDPCEGGLGKQQCQLLTPARIDFVEMQCADIRQSCHESAMSGARFKNDISCEWLRQNHGQACEVCGRRELLIPDLVFTSDRMCRQCLDKRTDLRDLVQHLRLVQHSGHVARQCRLEQVKGVPLAPGAVCGALPVELAHRLKQTLLVRQSGCDGVLDFGDCCVQLLAGLFKKVGHGLLLMLNRIRSSPSPLWRSCFVSGRRSQLEERLLIE